MIMRLRLPTTNLLASLVFLLGCAGISASGAAAPAPRAAGISASGAAAPAPRAAVQERSLLAEIGFHQADHDALKKTYGYNWLYPQAFAIDPVSSELFILRGATAGTNKWAWIEVYDLPSRVLKTTFTTGQRWKESLVVRRLGARRYLYTIGDASVIRLDVTTLPARLSTLAPDASYVKAQSMMAFDGARFIVQDVDRRHAGVRHLFSVYDVNFKKIDELAFPKGDIGTLGNDIDRFPKMQGIAAMDGQFVVGTGAAYVPGQHRVSPGKVQGLQMFSANGERYASRLHPPEAMRDLLEKLVGYRPTCVENEGVTFADGALYSLWVTLGPADRERRENTRKGLVIAREDSPAGRDGRRK